jgi:hypothetical protein
VNWLLAGVLLAVFVAILVAAGASRRLLLVSVEAGRVVRVRGRAPIELLTDIEDVLARARATGRLLVRLAGGRAEVRPDGFDAVTVQRLRNVVGRFPVARLRTAPRVARG